MRNPYLFVVTEMHETLRSNSQLSTQCNSLGDEQHHYSRLPLASPKSTRVQKGDGIKSLALTQLPSTKLGLYKALQPLLKLTSPSKLHGLVICVCMYYYFNVLHEYKLRPMQILKKYRHVYVHTEQAQVLVGHKSDCFSVWRVDVVDEVSYCGCSGKTCHLFSDCSELLIVHC